MRKSKDHRKVWVEAHGPIPKDENGRSFEIHHINGNHQDNRLENLECLRIEEHFQRHLENGDFGACVLIGKRMSMSPEELSAVQRGVKRPGVGGVSKGTTPWNKGKKGYKLKRKPENKTKAVDSKFKKDWTDHWERLVVLYESKPTLEGVGEKQRNGLPLPYDREFSKRYFSEFPSLSTPQGLFRILKNFDSFKERAIRVCSK